MSPFPLPTALGQMHAHLRLLLLLTVVVRGGMYLGYPLQVKLDDTQAYHASLIERVATGDLLVGNLRYHPGYALTIAPVAAIAHHLGAFGDRFLLLVQVALSASIPFLLYDIVRRHHSRRAALFVALAALFDVFGLQWAHLYFAVWMPALCFTLAFWIMSRSLRPGRGNLAIACGAAGVILGLATLGRLNLAPSVALTGGLLLLLRQFPLRQRLLALVSLGGGCLTVLLVYFLAIHVPSTGVLRWNCIAGTNLILSAQGAGVPIVAENGPATARLLRLVSLPAIAQVDWSRNSHALWQTPGPWVEPEVKRAFLAQEPAGEVPEALDLWFPGVLVYHLGPCETDELLTSVALEAVLAHPLKFLGSLPAEMLHLLRQQQRVGWHLPHIDDLHLVDVASPTIPLKRAWSDRGHPDAGDYRGARLLPLPVRIYSLSRDLLHALKLIALPALVWGLISERPLYRGAAIILLFWLFMMALLTDAQPEDRLIAPLWPLWPLLIGGMLADLWPGLTRFLQKAGGNHIIGGPVPGR